MNKVESVYLDKNILTVTTDDGTKYIADISSPVLLVLKNNLRTMVDSMSTRLIRDAGTERNALAPPTRKKREATTGAVTLDL